MEESLLASLSMSATFSDSVSWGLGDSVGRMGPVAFLVEEENADLRVDERV
jgi:hypothetical protein